MTFKRKRTPTTYLPSRSNDAKKDLRRLAPNILNQQQLNLIWLQIGLKYAEPQRTEVRRRSFERIKPYLRFRAEEPECIAEPTDTPPSAA